MKKKRKSTCLTSKSHDNEIFKPDDETTRIYLTGHPPESHLKTFVGGI